MRIPGLFSSSSDPPRSMPIRSADPPPYTAESVRLSLHPSNDESAPGLLVKATPPSEPTGLGRRPNDHVPCDIVLVLDVSGSMQTPAPPPGDGQENCGFSVLDLAKHSARTILETMDETDSLGIVAFHTIVDVIQPLQPMTAENKELAKKNIESLEPRDTTNLWGGIKQGLNLFKDRPLDHKGRVSAVMVMTDGLPNYGCPPKGYVPKLQSMFPLPASISTFGFGTSLLSGLLRSISEISGGSYAFIPDAGMMGTVFIHAVANLRSTFSQKAVLSLTYPTGMQLKETTGHSLISQQPKTINDDEMQLRIDLGRLQYGQARDVWLSVECSKELLGAPMTAQLDFSPLGGSDAQMTMVRATMLDPVKLDPSQIAFHKSRSMICQFLSTMSTTRPDGEYVPIPSAMVPAKAAQLAEMVSSLPSQDFDDDNNQALIRDLVGVDPDGQVSIALEKPNFYEKWGKHYLPSLQCAHLHQMCNSFKDPGPQRYGVDSALFVACRDALDNAFDNLPPLVPSLPVVARRPSNNSTFWNSSSLSSWTAVSPPTTMSMYRRFDGPCFAGSTQVRLASGSAKPIRTLRREDEVETPAGSRLVAAVLKTWVRRVPMIRVAGLLVTPHHPISADAKVWGFPHNAWGRTNVLFTGFIYSVMLQGDENSASHAIKLGNNVWGVTLGHGLTGRVIAHDVRGHAFFGNHDKVSRAISRLGPDANGCYETAGVKRSRTMGLVVGFKKVTKAWLRTRRRVRREIRQGRKTELLRQTEGQATGHAQEGENTAPMQPPRRYVTTVFLLNGKAKSA